MPGGPMRVDTDRFVDQRYHELEVERLWKKVWQMACREDDIPNVGDYYIYDIAHLSYIVVRTGKKIYATIENARTMLALDKEYVGFGNYLRSFGSYAATSTDLRKRFKFLGELSAYYFLFRVGEPVPQFEEWERTVPGDHPRMREMIALAREKGTSPERAGA